MAYDFNSLTKQAAEATNRDGFYTDFEDVDPSKLHQITELTEWMRTKAKGSDVREVIAQLFERTWVESIKEDNANFEVAQARGSYPNLKSRLDNVDKKQHETTEQLAQKANKDEVTNVMTPKGTLAYASLPTSGNQIGWYYYCPDGDGTHGAGNYVWNGTSWYFGGTGDEGYNLLKKDLALVEKVSLGESDIYYKNITDVSVTNYVKTISGINAQSVTFYPVDDPLDGKKLAVRLTLSNGTIKYEAVTENKKYTYDGLTISEICIYVDGNYLTSPCIVSGQICIDTDKKPLVKRIEQNGNNIKQLEVESIKLNNNCKQNTLGIPTFNTGKWIDSNGVLNTGSSDDGYTDYFRVYKGQTVYVYGNSWAGANLISFYDDNKNYVSGVAGTGKAIESSFEVENDGYVRLCINTNIIPISKVYSFVMNPADNYVIDKYCKQNTLRTPAFNTGKWIDSNGVLNNGNSSDGYTDYFRVYKGQTVYVYGNSWAGANLISFYDDNKNYVNGEAGTGKAIESSFEVENDGYVRLCINTNIIPISNAYSFVMNPVDNYVIDKLRPIQDGQDDWISSKFDEITTKYRFIALTFQDYYQRLDLIGSNDFFDSAYEIKQNVFVPQLDRKTLRDPSWMFYKGYFYIVYTVEATKDDSLVTDTDFDEIGVVRTKDFITFYEYPHVHLSDSEHKFITAIWAPAFCVLDNKPYILTWARTSDDYGSFLFEYNPKTNEAKFIKKMNNMNLDTHIYKVNGSYYSVGNGDNEKGIKIMKSPTLTGDYTKIAELATSAYFEGAYLMPKDDGTWRILMKGTNGYYWSDSSTSELDSTWTNPVAVEKDFTWVEQHLTVIDMLNVDFNQLT